MMYRYLFTDDLGYNDLIQFQGPGTWDFVVEILDKLFLTA